MTNRVVCVGILSLAAGMFYEPCAGAATNGVILISTRWQQDTGLSIAAANTEYLSDEKGPGYTTPGDVAMGSLLADNGYSFRILPDRLLGPAGEGYGYPNTNYFLVPANPEMEVKLAIMSGSGASADTPPPPPGVPVMMGEHVCLGNNAARQGSLYMYNGTTSNDPNSDSSPPATQFMKVIAPDHPIMKGIPVDAQGRVKIFRDRYPNEESRTPVGAKKNYEYRWCTQAVADKAAGTTVLGVLDGAEDRACFAVVDNGGKLANGVSTSVRLVQLFCNENGSSGSRRVFLCLTDLGRVLFLRAAQWALGEELQPYQTFRIIDVSQAGAQKLKISWQGAAASNYRILGSTDGTTWTTAVDDIRGGLDGTVARTLDISQGPQALFLRVAPLPH